MTEKDSFETAYKNGYEQGKKDAVKEILQGFSQWTEQAISSSFENSVLGSEYCGGKNRAFHEVKDLIKKVKEHYGVKQ